MARKKVAQSSSCSCPPALPAPGRPSVPRSVPTAWRRLTSSSSTTRRRRTARPDHPGRDHDLRRPQLHLRPQDPAGAGADPSGGRPREGRRDDRPRSGRFDHACAGRRDRQDEDARPERQRPRRRRAPDRRHRPLHGHRSQVTQQPHRRPGPPLRASSTKERGRQLCRSEARNTKTRSRASTVSRCIRRSKRSST